MPIYILPLDPEDCPEEWGVDDLDRALPPGLRDDVSFYPKNDEGQPRFGCDSEHEDDVTTAANSICSYFSAKYFAPRIDESAEPY